MNHIQKITILIALTTPMVSLGQQSQSMNPFVHPSGKLIVFDSDQSGNRDIYIMDTYGQNIKRLTDSPMDDYGPEFVDDNTIRFQSDRDTVRRYYKFFTMKLDGSDIRKVDMPQYWYSAYTKNRELFYYVEKVDDNVDIYLKNIQTGQVDQLTNDIATDNDFTLSGDEKWIAYESFLNSVDDSQIIVMDALTGQGKRKIANGTDPVFAPMENKILFKRKKKGPYNLFIYNLDTNEEIFLAEKGALHNWLEDGKAIVFMKETDNGIYQIYRVNADGTNERALTPWTNDGVKK